MSSMIKKQKIEERSSTHFQIYITDKFYFLCNPKVASSWAYEHFGRGENKGLEARDSFNIADMTFGRGYKNGDDELTKEMYNDWEMLLNGKSCKKDWVFVIRNPIEKMITGYIQDIFLKHWPAESLENPVFLRHIKSIGYNKTEIDAFVKQYIADSTKEGQDNGTFPNVKNFGENNQFMPMYYDIVKSIVDYWAEDTIRVINEINYDHKESNLFFILKLLAFPPNEFDLSKIRVIDIDRQNLGETLKTLYGLKNINIKKQHSRQLSFKYLVFKAFQEHMPLVYSLLAHEALIYTEIINKLYPKEMYMQNSTEHKTIPPYVYTAQEFLNFNQVGESLIHYMKTENFSLYTLQHFLDNKIQTEVKILNQAQNHILENGGRLRDVINKNKKKNASIKASKYMVGKFL